MICRDYLIYFNREELFGVGISILDVLDSLIYNDRQA